MANSEEDFELMSTKDIKKLKKEIEEMRKGGSAGSSVAVNDSIEKLNENIASLTAVFKEAVMELQLDEGGMNLKGLNEINEKLDSVLDQNEKIAEAILTVADMVKELKENAPSGDAGYPPQDMGNPFGGGPQFGGAPEPFGNPEPFSPQGGSPPPFNPGGLQPGGMMGGPPPPGSPPGPPPAPGAPPPPGAPSGPPAKKKGLFSFK